MIAEQASASGRRNGLFGVRPRRRRDWLPVPRNGVQVGFVLFLVYTAWRFAQFVAHFETFGASPYVPRPASVEAFLPISALVALKAWVGTGRFDTVHPAGLTLFLAILGVSVLFKKGFCSWICPIGTLSEWLARFGRWVFGRNLRMPAFLDWSLRGLKYLLLAFFVWAIWLGMSAMEASAFLQTPYNKVADVKMLRFFTYLDSGVLAFLVTIAVLSLLFSNFWCRYLCPYGALLGLASVLSPLKVTRFPERCTDCGACTRACPNRLEVAKLQRVASPECTGCLDCVAACRRKGALGVAPPFARRPLSQWVLPGLLLGTFFAAILLAQVTGHWDSGVSYREYEQLIPMADRLSH